MNTITGQTSKELNRNNAFFIAIGHINPVSISPSRNKRTESFSCGVEKTDFNCRCQSNLTHTINWLSCKVIGCSRPDEMLRGASFRCFHLWKGETFRIIIGRQHLEGIYGLDGSGSHASNVKRAKKMAEHNRKKPILLLMIPLRLQIATLHPINFTNPIAYQNVIVFDHLSIYWFTNFIG